MATLKVLTAGAPDRLLPWLEGLSVSDRDELTQLIAGWDRSQSGAACRHWGVVADWLEEHGGRRSYAGWLQAEGSGGQEVASMRVSDATDGTFDALTSRGTVVVAFYMPPDNAYKAIQPKSQPPSPATGGLAFRPARRRRRTEDIRKALTSATWERDRKIKVVFADYVTCRATCHRLGVIGFATFWIMKDGERIAALNSMVQGGHRDSHRLARERFAEWLTQHLTP